MTKRFGFTLAEVLITLGIIGVVAAMTIPTLISNTNGAKFRSQFKKTLSTLNQAGLMAQAQYDFDYAGATGGITTGSGESATTSDCGSGDDPNSDMTFCALLNGTLTGYQYMGKPNSGAEEDTSTFSYSFTSTTLDAASNYIVYSLADGSMVGFDPSATGCSVAPGKTAGDLVVDAPECIGFIDVNGATLPNREVTCETASDTKLLAAAGEGEGAANVAAASCTVPNNANNMTDVFPIVFHDATVEPATNAARYVLTTSK